MKYGKIKQFLALALAAAVAATGLPGLSSQVIYASTKGSKTDTSGTATAGTVAGYSVTEHKHTTECYTDPVVYLDADDESNCSGITYGTDGVTKITLGDSNYGYYEKKIKTAYKLYVSGSINSWLYNPSTQVISKTGMSQIQMANVLTEGFAQDPNNYWDGKDTTNLGVETLDDDNVNRIKNGNRTAKTDVTKTYANGDLVVAQPKGGIVYGTVTDLARNRGWSVTNIQSNQKDISMTSEATTQEPRDLRLAGYKRYTAEQLKDCVDTNGKEITSAGVYKKDSIAYYVKLIDEELEKYVDETKNHLEVTYTDGEETYTRPLDTENGDVVSTGDPTKLSKLATVTAPTFKSGDSDTVLTPESGQIASNGAIIVSSDAIIASGKNVKVTAPTGYDKSLKLTITVKKYDNGDWTDQTADFTSAVTFESGIYEITTSAQSYLPAVQYLVVGEESFRICMNNVKDEKSYTDVSTGLTYHLVKDTAIRASYVERVISAGGMTITTKRDLSADTQGNCSYAVLTDANKFISKISDATATLNAISDWKTYQADEMVLNTGEYGQVVIKLQERGASTPTYFVSDVYYCYGMSSVDEEDAYTVYPTTENQTSVSENLGWYFTTGGEATSSAIVSIYKLGSDKKTLGEKIGNDLAKTTDYVITGPQVNETSDDEDNHDYLNMYRLELTKEYIGSLLTDKNLKAGDSIRVQIKFAENSVLTAWNAAVGDNDDQKMTATVSNTINFDVTRKDTVTFDANKADVDFSAFKTVASGSEIDDEVSAPVVFLTKNAKLKIGGKLTYQVDETTTEPLVYSIEGYNASTGKTMNVKEIAEAGVYTYSVYRNTDATTSLLNKGVASIGGIVYVETSIKDAIKIATTDAKPKNAAVTVSTPVTGSGDNGTIAIEAEFTTPAESTYTITANGYQFKLSDGTLADSVTLTPGDADSSETYTIVSKATKKEYQLTVSYKIGDFVEESKGSGNWSGSGTTDTKKDAQGNTVKEKTETKEDGSTVKTSEITISDDVKATVTVEQTKDGQTQTNAVVTDTAADDGTLVIMENTAKSIIEVSGTADTIITYQKIGKEVSVEASLVTAGQTLKLIDVSGKKEQLVDTEALLVNNQGVVTLDLTKLTGKKYQLVDETTEKAIGKQILKSIKVKKVVGKVGKKKTVKINKGSYKQSIKKITYKSLNKKIAKVNKKGKVTLKKSGKTKIKVTITLVNGQKKTYKRMIKIKK